jgi:hypothetical protein
MILPATQLSYSKSGKLFQKLPRFWPLREGKQKVKRSKRRKTIVGRRCTRWRYGTFATLFHGSIWVAPDHRGVGRAQGHGYGIVFPDLELAKTSRLS